jgi:hypothetical protein
VSNGPDQPESSEQDPYAAPAPGEQPPATGEPAAYRQAPPPYPAPPPVYGQAPPYDQPPPYGQAPYGQPPPYGQQLPYGPQQPYGYSTPPGTNGFAIASLICSFFCVPLGLIFGFVAKSQIKRTGQAGNGLATAGIIISVASIVLFFVVAGLAGSHSSTP